MCSLSGLAFGRVQTIADKQPFIQYHDRLAKRLFVFIVTNAANHSSVWIRCRFDVTIECAIFAQKSHQMRLGFCVCFCFFFFSLIFYFLFCYRCCCSFHLLYCSFFRSIFCSLLQHVFCPLLRWRHSSICVEVRDLVAVTIHLCFLFDSLGMLSSSSSSSSVKTHC